MNKHLSKGLIKKLALLSTERQPVTPLPTHIADCALCKSKYEFYMSLLCASDNTGLQPREHVKANIIRIYRNSADSPRVKASLADAIRTLLRPALISLVIFCVALSSIFVYKRFSAPQAQNILLELSAMHGSVLTNNRPASLSEKIGHNTVIHTGINSHTVCSYASRFSIVLAAHTELVITQARQTADHSLQFNFFLRQGTIFADFKQQGGDLRYAFTTPAASLTSIATAFMLEALPAQTKLVLVKGSLHIATATTGVTLKASPQQTYIIKDKIQTEKIHESDKKIINTLEKISSSISPQSILKTSLQGLSEKNLPQMKNAHPDKQNRHNQSPDKSGNITADEQRKLKEERSEVRKTREELRQGRKDIHDMRDSRRQR